MKTRTLRILMAFSFVFLAVSLSPQRAKAFGESEDQLFQEDISEAKARAKDFNIQRVREATEDLKRQEGAKEVKRERADWEESQERLRKNYVKDRNARPSEWLEQARLERQFDERQIADEKQMEKSRREFKQKRARVLKLIQSEAHIDENQEYGL